MRHPKLFPVLRCEDGFCFTVVRSITSKQTKDLFSLLDCSDWYEDESSHTPDVPCDLLTYCRTEEMDCGEWIGELRVYHVTDQVELDRLVAREARCQRHDFGISGFRMRKTPLSAPGVSLVETLPIEIARVNREELHLFSKDLDQLCWIFQQVSEYATSQPKDLEQGGALQKYCYHLGSIMQRIVGFSEKTDIETISSNFIKNATRDCRYCNPREFYALIFSGFISPFCKCEESVFIKLMINRTRLYQLFIAPMVAPDETYRSEMKRQFAESLMDRFASANEGLKPLMQAIDIEMYCSLQPDQMKYHEEESE